MDQIFDGKVPTELADWAKALEGEYQQKQEAAAAVPKVSNPVKTDKVQAGLARGAIRAAKEGLPVYSVSSDVQGSTGIATFQKSFLTVSWRWALPKRT